MIFEIIQGSYYFKLFIAAKKSFENVLFVPEQDIFNQMPAGIIMGREDIMNMNNYASIERRQDL